MRFLLNLNFISVAKISILFNSGIYFFLGIVCCGKKWETLSLRGLTLWISWSHTHCLDLAGGDGLELGDLTSSLS